MEMNEKTMQLAHEAVEKVDDYFNEISKVYGKKGFVWIKNDETGQLIVYTRGEYTEQIITFLEALDKAEKMRGSGDDESSE